MKQKNNIILCSTLILLSCQERIADKPIVLQKENEVALISRIDSLYNLYNRNHDTDLLDKINDIACRVDGSTSEYLDAVSTELYKESFVYFVRFLSKNPRSCLEQSFIRGVSADLSVEDIERRHTIMKEMKIHALTNNEINKNDKTYITSVLNRVKLNSSD